SDLAFVEEFGSLPWGSTDNEREVSIVRHYSDERFERLANGLLSASPDNSSVFHKSWLISLSRHDYSQIEHLMKPFTELQRDGNGTLIHRPDKIGKRRLTAYALIIERLL